MASQVAGDLNRRHALRALLPNDCGIETHLATLKHAFRFGLHDAFVLALADAAPLELRDPQPSPSA